PQRRDVRSQSLVEVGVEKLEEAPKLFAGADDAGRLVLDGQHQADACRDLPCSAHVSDHLGHGLVGPRLAQEGEHPHEIGTEALGDSARPLEQRQLGLDGDSLRHAEVAGACYLALVEWRLEDRRRDAADPQAVPCEDVGYALDLVVGQVNDVLAVYLPDFDQLEAPLRGTTTG